MPEVISADPDLTPADAERLKALYGLDRPIFERYLTWLQAALSGDFGFSRLHAKPVTDVLLPALGNFDSPILVAGCQRSGGTMLAFALSRHREVVDFKWSQDAELHAALIEIGACRAVVSIPRKNFSRASGALLHELGSITVVQMPQNHHGRVFRSTQMVELVVIALAKIQESLPVVQKFTIQFFVIIVQDLDHSAFAVFNHD